MEEWIVYERIKNKIELIESFTGGNMKCVICFLGEDKNEYTLSFDDVYDFRYAIETAFIGRDANTTSESSQNFNSIYIVEESEYIKKFKHDTCECISTENMKHFIIFDSIDTGIEILTIKEPLFNTGHR